MRVCVCVGVCLLSLLLFLSCLIFTIPNTHRQKPLNPAWGNLFSRFLMLQAESFKCDKWICSANCL